MPEATVAVSMLRALLAYLGTQDLDTDALARASGLNREVLAHPERTVDASHYERLMQAGIVALHNPLLGLEFGMAAQPDRWGTLGFLLRHCATLGEVLSYQARFAHLVNAVGEGRFVEHEHHVALEWHSAGSQMPALVEEAFGAWVRFARWASGREESPTLVEFSHRAQGDPALYEAFFDCPVVFCAPACRLCFDPALLDVALRTPDAQLAAHLSDRVEARARAAGDRDVHIRLKAWLMQTIGNTTPELGRAAQALGLGERVLQQRLQTGGTTFRRCVDEARHELALRHLRDSRLSIGDVSHRLGYSEQSVFQRAFRRWQGQTPLAWRRQH
ncbi:AraC family transcriptional regulator [Salinisphaera dokdonensis CL-ES53]|uniref:AraC family transcriptional regulator n=2 Tax=Salinisphaera TaxID=180541 RepID=A0ABV2AWX1_9GAMM